MSWTDLDRVQQAMGAEPTDFQGSRLPRAFAPLATEWAAVRRHAGLLDGRNRRLLSLIGGDRVTFLQGMISNDVAKLTDGDGTYAALLTIQGKLVSDLYVYVLADRLILDVPAGRHDAVRAALDRYIVADDVEFEDRTLDSLLAVEGPQAATILASVADTPVDGLRPWAHRECVIGGRTFRCLAVSQTGEKGFRLLGNPDEVTPLWQSLLGAGATPVGLDTLGVLRLEAGIPWFGIDMDEDTLVMEVGLEGAISFTKGCYLGQEVVERVAARGHVNRKLGGLIAAGPVIPSAGTPLIYAGKEVGLVTSAAHSPALDRVIALGYLHRGACEPGTTVHAGLGSDQLEMTVTERPFYRSAATHS
jgi:folate-binding protein YgfZ